MRRAVAVGWLGLVVLAGCAHDEPSAAPADPFAQCAAVAQSDLDAAVGAPATRVVDLAPICLWQAATPAGVVGLTYGWSAQESLQRESDLAGRLGYTITRSTVTHGSSHSAGLIWRDPHDPAACGESVAVNGVVTWWVHGVPGAAGDPCVVAGRLAELSVVIDA